MTIWCIPFYRFSPSLCSLPTMSVKVSAVITISGQSTYIWHYRERLCLLSNYHVTVSTQHTLFQYLATLFRYDWPPSPPTANNMSLSTAIPTAHLHLLMAAAIFQSADWGSNLSTEAVPSPLQQPPTANNTSHRQAGVCGHGPCVSGRSCGSMGQFLT